MDITVIGTKGHHQYMTTKKFKEIFPGFASALNKKGVLAIEADQVYYFVLHDNRFRENLLRVMSQISGKKNPLIVEIGLN